MDNTVVVADLLLPKGHADFNTKYLSALSMNANVRIVPGLLREHAFLCGDFDRRERLKPCEGKIAGRIQARKNAAITSRFWKKVPDAPLVLLASDPMMLLFASSLRGNVLMVHHKDIDELSASAIKRACFNLYKNQIHHAVGEPFIGRCLIDELGVDPGRVHVCPHSIVEASCPNDGSLFVSHSYGAVGLSGSNDPGFVQAIADFERHTSFFARNNCKVYLKGRFSFDDGYLKISPVKLEAKTYELMLQRAKISLSPFPPSFRNRVSGTLFDGLSHRCVIVATSYTMAKFYSDCHPGLVYCEDNVEQFCQKVLDLSNERDLVASRESAFKALFFNHSIKRIADALSVAFEAMERLGVD